MFELMLETQTVKGKLVALRKAGLITEEYYNRLVANISASFERIYARIGRTDSERLKREIERQIRISKTLVWDCVKQSQKQEAVAI